MVEIAKVGTKPVSYKPPYDETLRQFKLTNEEFSKLKPGSIIPEKGLLKLKAKSITPGEEFLKLKAKSITPEVGLLKLKAKKINEPLTEIFPKLAKKTPLWKWAIGKIFG